MEHALAHIEDLIGGKVEPRLRCRWFAVKLFERDEKVVAELKLSEDVKKGIEEAVSSCEKEMDDDAESHHHQSALRLHQHLDAERGEEGQGKGQPERFGQD